MEIKEVNISEIKPNESNPRTITEDKFKKLVQSIKDFPEMLNIRPIVVNKEMIILGGNMRYKALVEAGVTEVPIIIADKLTKKQEKEFLIKDNVSGGQWDWDILANEWDSQELDEWGLDIPLFEDTETNYEVDDIDLVDDFNESINFTIKCENIDQLEELKTKLNTDAQKIGYNDFLIKVGL